ncbi:Flagellar basal body-associated protein FliL [compost metagenome]
MAGRLSKIKLPLLLGLAFLLAIGLSVGGTWFFLNKQDKDETAAETSAEQAGNGRKPALYEQLAPAFVVNFSQGGRPRYMQVSLALMGRDQAQLDALREQMPLVRNQLVMLFSGQNFDSLTTPVGKEMLRQMATAKVQEVAKKATGKVVVEQVFFTNFVLQ